MEETFYQNYSAKMHENVCLTMSVCYGQAEQKEKCLKMELLIADSDVAVRCLLELKYKNCKNLNVFVSYVE